MRISFLCSSLEPGRDGVGDYTRRLAGEFIRQGHLCVAVALNDAHINAVVSETQQIQGISVSVLRLPDKMPWSLRKLETSKWLAKFNPDWFSLQFVPFGFHPKGLCFGLGKWLETLNPTAYWHIMFHELWLGLDKKCPVKHRVWGGLQRFIILDMVRRLRPQMVHTQADLYRETLSHHKIASAILPLFSNIPQSSGDGWSKLLEPLVTKAVRKPEARTNFYLAGVFGAVAPEWSAEKAVDSLLPLTQRFQKKLVLVFFGKNNLSAETFNKLINQLQDRAIVIVAGARNDFEISIILQALDIGLATTPLQLIQKSGSVAAMLEHGLSVLVTRDDWHLRGTKNPFENKCPRLLTPKQMATLQTLPIRESLKPAANGVKQTADQMLSSMKSSLRSSPLAKSGKVINSFGR